MVYPALEASNILQREGIEARVINSSSIKPLDNELIISAAKETGAIITGEEHSTINGLGSAVAELLSENCPTIVKRIGINDCFGQSGSTDELMKYYGLTAEALANSAKNILKKKQNSPSEKIFPITAEAVLEQV